MFNGGKCGILNLNAFTDTSLLMVMILFYASVNFSLGFIKLN